MPVTSVPILNDPAPSLASKSSSKNGALNITSALLLLMPA